MTVVSSDHLSSSQLSFLNDKDQNQAQRCALILSLGEASLATTVSCTYLSDFPVGKDMLLFPINCLIFLAAIHF